MLLVRLDGDGPLHRQTYRALRDAILAGRLRPGERRTADRRAHRAEPRDLEPAARVAAVRLPLRRAGVRGPAARRVGTPARPPCAAAVGATPRLPAAGRRRGAARRARRLPIARARRRVRARADPDRARLAAGDRPDDTAAGRCGRPRRHRGAALHRLLLLLDGGRRRGGPRAGRRARPARRASRRHRAGAPRLRHAVASRTTTTASSASRATSSSACRRSTGTGRCSTPAPRRRCSFQRYASIEQLAFADLICEGHLERHVRRIRTRHAARRAALLDAAGRELG